MSQKVTIQLKGDLGTDLCILGIKAGDTYDANIPDNNICEESAYFYARINGYRYYLCVNPHNYTIIEKHEK